MINKQILEKLNQIQIDINLIKQNSINPDSILTSEEEDNLDEALEEYERGEIISLNEIEKERENA